MIKTVVGSFDSICRSRRAARDLRAAGFLDSDVNVIANNAQQRARQEGETGRRRRSQRRGDRHRRRRRAGRRRRYLRRASWVSRFPASARSWRRDRSPPRWRARAPARSPGGLIGGLTDLGVDETHAEFYAEAVRRGGALVTVRADESRADEAEQIIRRHGAYDIEDRVVQWKSEGWKGYDPERRAVHVRGDRAQPHAIPRRARGHRG